MNGSVASRPRRFVLLLIVAALALAADYATKEIALDRFVPGESVEVVGDLLKFTLVFNTGAAFSIGSGVPWVFFLIASGVVGYILFMARKLYSVGWAVALGLILGGATGNLIDRVMRPPAPLHGAVVDWIQIPNWPVFNLADSGIVVGGALAIVLAFKGINLDGTVEAEGTAAQGARTGTAAPRTAGGEDREQPAAPVRDQHEDRPEPEGDAEEDTGGGRQ
ncbi:MAG: signal peptidase II [Nocardiopsaceae bacterium]|nr:signal peptidase II [Nocardiopsaceae bacterium]